MTSRSSSEYHDPIEATGPDWVRDTIFYQVFPDRFYNGDPSNDPPAVAGWEAAPSYDNFFGGDLAGIMQKLSHLEQLGVSGLYMTPVFKAGTNHRYDTHDYFTIDPALGDPGALRELVDEAHRRGIRVLLDGVFNHVGDGFWAFRDVINQGEASKCRDWFYFHNLPVSTDPPSYQTCGGTYYLPKLNTETAAVRQHLLSVATHWIDEAGIDGWRLDVPWKVPPDFWRAFRSRVKQHKPDAYLVGEAWWSWGAMRDVFDGLMNYRLRARLLDFCVFDSQDAEDFAIELNQLLDDSDGGDLMLNLIGSHDTARILTVAGGDEDRVALTLTALFTLPGSPMLYYGDEIGMQGGDDPDCRRTMCWDESSWNRRIYTLTRKLVALRNEHVALRRGRCEVIFAFNRVLAFKRSSDGDEVVVVLNPGPERRDFAIRHSVSAGADELVDLLTGTPYRAGDGALTFPRLPARTGVVLTRRTNGESPTR